MASIGIHVQGHEAVRTVAKEEFHCELLGERPKWAPRLKEAGSCDPVLTAKEPTRDSPLDKQLSAFKPNVVATMALPERYAYTA